MVRIMMRILLAAVCCGAFGCATWVDRSGEAARSFEISDCEQSCGVFDSKSPERLDCMTKCMKKKGFVRADKRPSDT